MVFTKITLMLRVVASAAVFGGVADHIPVVQPGASELARLEHVQREWGKADEDPRTRLASLPKRHRLGNSCSG